MKAKKKIGDILLQIDMITPEELDRCLEIQKRSDLKLGEIVLNEGILTKEQMAGVLEYQYELPFIDLKEVEIDRNVVTKLSESIARKHTVIPIAINNGKLAIAMADPDDIIARDDVRLITNYEIDIYMAFKADILKAIDNFYDKSDQIQGELVGRLVDDEEYEEEDGASQGNSITINSGDEDKNISPIIAIVNNIIKKSVKIGASDIHIEPFENTTKVRYRVDGVLRLDFEPPKKSYNAITTRIKILGGMDISEKRIPQDGRIETDVDGKKVDLRISVLPTVYGEKIVIRLLDRSSIMMTKEKIGFTPHNTALFDKIIKVPEGIVLLTGPTGSGKTTTLYAALRELNKPTANIITAEDPVEYRLEGVNQVHINAKAGLTFAAALRSMLRQDPDIIMVGEIRDAETAEIAIRAAITGHVVLSTLHTNDTISTITRLVDMGIEPFLVATSLVGVIAQRLVKRICTGCKTQVAISVQERAILKLKDDEEVKIYKGKGCPNCNNTGYKGRIGVHEILALSKEMKNLVTKNAGLEQLRNEAKNCGMISLNESCRILVLQGVTTIEELLRVAYSIDD